MHVFLWHVLLRRSLSALFAYTLFAFAMALLALLAPPEFAAFAAFSFVRLSMHWHVRAFAYSATLYAFFYVPGDGTSSMGGRMWWNNGGCHGPWPMPSLCQCRAYANAEPRHPAPEHRV
jgi:hypothetical protein